VKGIDTKEALELIALEGKAVYALLARANTVRLETRGMTVRLCGVLNAKSGNCTEDCKFCAQSAHNEANIDCYSLMSADRMVAAASRCQENRAGRFGIVTAGVATENPAEVVQIEKAVHTISRELKIKPCASLGKISKETLVRLKEAGLTRYHCNLETAESFFQNICTTRPWQEAVNTVKAAKEVGLAACSGGLFGLGESPAQRVELLDAVRDLDVDAVPLNFFNPIEGTALDHLKPLTPLECLQVVAVARLMMPTKEIRVCGGREKNLRDLQSVALISGADGLMVGGYLTTGGRAVEDDLQMIADAGFEVAWD